MSRKVIVLLCDPETGFQVVNLLNNKCNAISARSFIDSMACDSHISVNLCYFLQERVLSMMSILESCGNDKPHIVYDWSFGKYELLSRNSDILLSVRSSDNNIYKIANMIESVLLR